MQAEAPDLIGGGVNLVEQPPQLAPVPSAVRGLSDEILNSRLEVLSTLPSFELPIDIDPNRLYEDLLESPLNDFLLPPGASLSVENPDDEYFPDLGLSAGFADLTGVRVGAAGWGSTSEDPARFPGEVVSANDPRENFWARSLTLTLLYGNDEQGEDSARQTLVLYTDSVRDEKGEAPVISRVVSAKRYRLNEEYQGHGKLVDPREVTREDAEAFVTIVESLIQGSGHSQDERLAA